MGLHKHMIQEVVSQHDYRLVAIFIGLGPGESFLSSTWVAARFGSLCNGSMQRTLSPQQSLFLEKPK